MPYFPSGGIIDVSSLKVTDEAGTGGTVQFKDENHSIYGRESGFDQTNYYEWGASLAGGGGHRFLTGGPKELQTLRMQIADDLIAFFSALLFADKAPDTPVKGNFWFEGTTFKFHNGTGIRTFTSS